jgi:hypothetical protein
MAKLTLTDLASLANQQSAINQINTNSEAIEEALEKTLSRDGTSPNEMEADLDMNSNRILNLPEAVDDTEPVRLGDLEDLVEELAASETFIGPEGPEGPQGATGATGATGPEGPEGPPGASGTDFLALGDTPDSYSGFAGNTTTRGALVGVNTAGDELEFKYSTAGYIDIRDYGTVADGGAITTALQAALDAITGVGNSCVRIPMVGNGVYTCGDITFPSQPVILEFDCSEITITGSATWSIPGAYVLRGLRSRSLGIPYPYGPLPAPIIKGFGHPLIETVASATNLIFENLEIIGLDGTALYLHAAEIVTVRNCMFRSSHSFRPAFHAESVFWVQILNCCAEPGFDTGPVAGGYGFLFSTLEDWGKNTGIVLMKDIICLRNGMKFECQYGPSGIDNTDIERYHVEGILDNGAVIHFDSTAGPGQIGNFYIRDCEVSDAVGSVWSTILNEGTGTRGIVWAGANRGGPIDVTGDPIENFVIDYTKGNLGDGNMATAFNSLWSGTSAAHGHQYRAPGAIDTRLLTAPVGLPWTVYDPLPVDQDPTDWLPVDGPETVTPVLGPDGSMMGGLVVSGGGSGVTCYGSLGNLMTLSQGDVFLFGAWGRHPSQGSFLATALSGIEILGGMGSTVDLDDGYDGHLTAELEDRIADNGWRWFCRAVRITNNTFSNDCAVRFRLGAGREWFAPCAMYIPAADVADIDEVHLRNLERSLKGGWSSSAVRGDVALLDHQELRVKGTYVALQGAQTIWIPAGALTPRVTAGSVAATRETNGITIGVQEFADGSDTGANFNIAFPKSRNAGTVNYSTAWTAGSGSGTVEFELRGGSFADDAAINTSGFGTAVAVTDTLLATNDVHWGPISSAVTIANAGDDRLTFFEIIRDVSDDTLNGTAELLGIKFFYVVTAGNDA